MAFCKGFWSRPSSFNRLAFLFIRWRRNSSYSDNSINQVGTFIKLSYGLGIGGSMQYQNSTTMTTTTQKMVGSSKFLPLALVEVIFLCVGCAKDISQKNNFLRGSPPVENNFLLSSSIPKSSNEISGLSLTQNEIPTLKVSFTSTLVSTSCTSEKDVSWAGFDEPHIMLLKTEMDASLPRPMSLRPPMPCNALRSLFDVPKRDEERFVNKLSVRFLSYFLRRQIKSHTPIQQHLVIIVVLLCTTSTVKHQET